MGNDFEPTGGAGAPVPASAAPSPPPLPPPPPQSDRPSQWKRGFPLPLRPRGVGETLDAAINLYRLHWKQFMTLIAVLVVPFQFVTHALQFATAHDVVLYRSGQVVRQPSVAVSFLVVALSFVVLDPLLRGSATRAVADAYLGQEPRWRDCLRFALSKFWILLGVSLLGGLLTALGFIIIVPGILMAIRYTVAPMAVVVEDQGVTGALSRAWNLCKGRTGHMFLVLLVAGILSAIITGILSAPAAFLGTSSSWWAWILQAIFASVAAILVTPFSTIVAVLLYFDARIRKEGFDIAVMAQELR
jgi:hypothetical protein